MAKILTTIVLLGGAWLVFKVIAARAEAGKRAMARSQRDAGQRERDGSTAIPLRKDPVSGAYVPDDDNHTS